MYKSFVFIALLLFAGTTVQANVVVRTADQLEVAEGATVEGELVAVGLPVVLSNEVTEDATLIGNRVTVNGEVGHDLLAAGFFVDVNSPVQDDVRIVGGEVSISSDVAGDLIIFGGTVDILSSATVEGDVIVYGGAVTVAGPVGGDVVGVMETLLIDTAIGGGIDVTLTDFTLGNQASITEAVRYTSHNLVSQSLNAIIASDIVRSDPPALQDSGWMRMSFIIFLVGLFSALVWHLCSRKSLTAVVVQSTAHPLRSALIGFIAPIVFLVVVGVLFISQLGLYIGFVVLFATITLIFLAGAASPAVVGQLLLQAIQHPPINGPLPIVMGVLVLTVCMFVPVVGVFLIGVVWMIAFGGLLEALLHANS